MTTRTFEIGSGSGSGQGVSVNINYRDMICQAIAEKNAELRDINKKIFDNPELGFEEYKAHDNLVALLESLGFDVNPHAYGVHTSFSTEYGSGGRVVTFNAEYDALPGIGHACGHNLIATSSLASFLGVVSVLKQTGIPGRVRLLGTPAEEGGGGKIRLVKAGAYDDVHACFMSHAGPSQLFKAPSTGSAYGTSLSMSKFAVSFEGKPAHAAFAPYLGVNALDAVSVAYSAIGLLRQQIKQHERIHFIIKHGGDAANVIPVAATSENQVRSGSLKELRELKARVMKCFEGAAIATGCTMESTEILEYADLRPNKAICTLYADEMASFDTPVDCNLENLVAGAGSTDQGNVSYVCPSFHSVFSIKTAPGAWNHTAGFTAAAGTDDAYLQSLASAKGMACAAWKILSDDIVAKKVQDAFNADKAIR